MQFDWKICKHLYIGSPGKGLSTNKCQLINVNTVERRVVEIGLDHIAVLFSDSCKYS